MDQMVELRAFAHRAGETEPLGPDVVLVVVWPLQAWQGLPLGDVVRTALRAVPRAVAAQIQIRGPGFWGGAGPVPDGLSVTVRLLIRSVVPDGTEPASLSFSVDVPADLDRDRGALERILEAARDGLSPRVRQVLETRIRPAAAEGT